MSEQDQFDGCDYPAAHSMDTTWFAVDKDGFVAVMETNEEGALPLAWPNGESASDFVETVGSHLGREVKLGQYEIPEPSSVGLYGFTSIIDENPQKGGVVDQALDDPDSTEFEVLVPVYKRGSVPSNPVHISELPETIQSQSKTLVFKDVSFRDVEWLQPVLMVPCQLWTDGSESVGVVDTEGNIVPVPPENFPQWGSPEAKAAQQPSLAQKDVPWWKKLFGV